jgi:hypothetical protein
VISDYLDSLARALDFDRSLSRCVRQEVEDHLWEAVAADPTGNRLEAERRAIAHFGDPHVIAAQFALISLVKQARRTAAAIIAIIFGVFIAMKARVAWYAVTQWAMSDDMKAVSGIVLLIDRYSFWVSVFLGIAGFVYIGVRRVPLAVHLACHKHLRRFFLLCTVATGALIVSVISDGVLTAFQLRGTQWSTGSLIPILSMAFEIACVGVLVFQIRFITQRTTCTAGLFRDA